jgi:acyl-CoA dehydrogenase
MTLLPWLAAAMLLGLSLAYAAARGWAWALGFGLLLALFHVTVARDAAGVWWLWSVFGVLAAVLGVAPLRRRLLSEPLLAWFRRALPAVSQTEQEALDAGTVWWDGELFGGDPDWDRLLGMPPPRLSDEEQAFLDGPVEALCAMLDDWQVSHELNDLPPRAWRFIRDNGFLGIIIPKEYGGLGFSALAHSEIVAKLATRTPAGTVTVMVPNSLGPAELLLNYGTEAQKRHYLPRLARGLEIPCFALTGPDAGSDAGSIPDLGVVCRGTHQGRETLGIRVTWEKRYITLGPVATLLGLAFRLHDPDHLIGDRDEPGITLALIPTDHPGVVIGRRHLPLNASFMNGPTSGKDVFLPMDWVIGGQARVGQGWRMLMECLAAGRAISLPSTSAGAMKLAARTTGAYSRIRTQFRTPIARFEGVEEALARIAAHTYAIDAARVMTAVAVDRGEKPAVVSAIVKYHATERARSVINDAMDVHGGKGICLGPGNYLGRAYQQVPIGITVEGANILTRSMIIFGQGVIRSHPFVLREIAATREADPRKAIEVFDAAVWGHLCSGLRNLARAFVLGLTGGRPARAAGAAATRQHFRHLSRLAAAFAFAADVALLVLGGALKRREKLSGRLADVLGHLYLASAVLKRHVDDGRPAADLPIVRWCVEDALHRAESALAGVVANFPNRAFAVLLRLALFPRGRLHAAPGDHLGSAVANVLTGPSEARDRLTRGMFVRREESDPVGRLELALELVADAETIETKLRAALKAGALHGRSDEERGRSALSQGILTPEEAALLERFRRVRRACIMVDDFPRDVGRLAGAEPAEPAGAGGAA